MKVRVFNDATTRRSAGHALFGLAKVQLEPTTQGTEAEARPSSTVDAVLPTLLVALVVVLLAVFVLFTLSLTFSSFFV